MTLSYNYIIMRLVSTNIWALRKGFQIIGIVVEFRKKFLY